MYKIKAYVVSRGKKKNNKNLKKPFGIDDFKTEFMIELDEEEEVFELKKLYEQDTQGHEELFFAIICKQQTRVRICKVSLDENKKPVIVVKEQVLVTKAKKRSDGRVENDNDPKNGTKLE